MKIKINQNCSYRSKDYKKGEEVTVNKEVGDVLLKFKYADPVVEKEKEVEDPVSESVIEYDCIIRDCKELLEN